MLEPVSKAKTFVNVVYTSLTKGAAVVCQVIASLIVARNLTPADYGVVGFAFIVIGFVSRFSDLGLETAVIRSSRFDRGNLWTAFTLKIILSMGAFVVALLVAPCAHYFLGHPATGNVIRLLALNFLVSTIGFAPRITLEREMNYRALLLPSILGAVVRCLLITALILRGWNYWAIIVAEVCANLATGLATQVVRPVGLQLHFDWTEAQDYLRFGLPLFGSGVVVFLMFNLDNFLVGTVMGSKQLGYYALAFSWASFICPLLSETVNGVLLPTFSAIQNDLSAVRRWYLKTIDLVAFVAVVSNTALLANAHSFLFLLGKGTGKWGPAELSLQILCFYGILRAMTEPLGPCILARGRSKLLWHSNLLAGIVEVGLLLAVLRSGRIEMVAAVVGLAYLTQVFVYLPYLRQDLSVDFGDLVAQLWPILPAIAAGWILTSLLPSAAGAGGILTLAARGLFTASVVAVTHGLFSRFRCFQEARGMILQSVARATG
jgi:O-antigen/teichoic acid export membrane protein